MTQDDVIAALRQKVGADCGLGAVVKFDLGDAGIVYLDAETVPNVVDGEEREAACTLTVTLADLQAIAAGELDGGTAFMMGKLKIDGDMGLAMKLQGLLS